MSSQIDGKTQSRPGNLNHVFQWFMASQLGSMQCGRATLAGGIHIDPIVLVLAI